MNPTVLDGKVEIAFRNFLIPSYLLSEATVTVTEGERERTTLAGTFRRGSGTFDEVMVTVTLYIPSMDWLGENILRQNYTAGTGTLPGNMIYNAATCSASADVGKVNIHPVCNETDDDDVYFYNAHLRVNMEATYNSDDDLTVELTFYGNPDADGNVVRFGTGNLTAASSYDVTTQATVVNP